jgi:hypothetical protein
MSSDLYYMVLNHFKDRLPNTALHSHIAIAPSPDSQALQPQAVFFDHVVMNHHRYSASHRSTSLADALVAVWISDHGEHRLWVGKLQDIFTVDQARIGTHTFGWMNWFCPTSLDTSGMVWKQLCATCFKPESTVILTWGLLASLSMYKYGRQTNFLGIMTMVLSV